MSGLFLFYAIPVRGAYLVGFRVSLTADNEIMKINQVRR